MRLTFHTSDPINPQQLTQELQDAGIQAVVSQVENGIAIEAEADASFAIEQVVAAHRSTEFADLDALQSKCEAVWRGDDTFTNRQAQQLIARLALFVIRRVR